jgi:hypothetical protein
MGAISCFEDPREMRTLRFMPFPLVLLVTLHAAAQAPSPVAPAPSEPAAPSSVNAPPAPAEPYPTGTEASAGGSIRLGAEGSAAPDAENGVSGDTAVDGGAAADGVTSLAPEHRTGFTTGLRLGVGVPLGKAGQDILTGDERDLSELTSWRAPIWIDVGYSPSGSTTLGAYMQVGVGGNGDACIADCDWSDIRIGASAEWRLLPGAAADPWLGVGLGYEWLSYRVLISAMVADANGVLQTVRGRATERFGGPELMLHGGVDFQVDDALRIGPYASATVSQYLTDSFRCQPQTDLCPEDGSIDGAGFHSWIGVGVRGAYTP